MNFFRRFLLSKDGNFGLLTALIAIPLIGAAGIAIDLSQALFLKEQLQSAADAAAIGAINEKSAAFAQAVALSGNGQINLDGTEAQQIFFSQSVSGLSDADVRADIALKKDAGVISSQVNYIATIPTTLMGILGQQSITVGGTASARYQTPEFLDIYMLLDNTPSMGIGATAADMDKLRTATTCAFACHVVSSSGQEDMSARNTYYRGRLAGATIRLDLVSQAVSDTAQKIKTIQIATGQVQISAYDFGSVTNYYAGLPTPQIETLVNPTIDLNSFASGALNLSLMKVPAIPSYGLTDLSVVLGEINNKILSVGTGSSISDRQPVVVLVGDGVSDHYNTPMSECTGIVIDGGIRCVEPLRTASCDALKNRGIKIAVLYTVYDDIPEDPTWTTSVKPYRDNISRQMQACASPGYYTEVTPTHPMGDAMDTLFSQIIAPPRLTN